MSEDRSKSLKELVRIERVLPKRGAHFQDLILVKCAALQERPFGLARVRPGRKVLLHDIEFTVTAGEARALFGAVCALTLPAQALEREAKARRDTQVGSGQEVKRLRAALAFARSAIKSRVKAGLKHVRGNSSSPPQRSESAPLFAEPSDEPLAVSPTALVSDTTYETIPGETLRKLNEGQCAHEWDTGKYPYCVLCGVPKPD